jgi:hypothetical protein
MLPWSRANRSDEPLDPELEQLVTAHTTPPSVDDADLARGRLLVAAKLRDARGEARPAGIGRLRPRLALAALGGGGLWASVAGAAAAHPIAATAVGLSVLVAGATTAEVSDIGPQVSALVRQNPQATQPAQVTTETATAPATAEATAVASVQASSTPATLDELAETPGAAVTQAPDDLPGNLMTQLAPNGHLTVRGVLVEVDGDTILVLTSLDDVPLEFDITDANVQIPGPPSGPNARELEDFEGGLVQLSGRCELVDDLTTEDCVIERVTVLGSAGQGANDGTDVDGALSLAATHDDDPESEDGDSDVQEGLGAGQGRPEHSGGPGIQSAEG